MPLRNLWLSVVNQSPLHLLAIAHAANVDLSRGLQYDQTCASLADLKPSGQYVFQDLYEVGGVPAVVNTSWQMVSFMATVSHVLVRQSLKTLADFADLTRPKKVIMPLENPKRADGPLIILNGNLAPDGAVAKVSGVKVRRHVGPARSLTQKKMRFRLS